MKRAIILLWILLSILSLKGQELSKIDITVAQYPGTFNSSEELASLINKDFKTDEDKARAIYSWIARNVQFDTDAYFSKKKKKRIKYKDKVDRAQKLRKQRLNMEHKALTAHKAVSEGYATLFNRLCELTGIYGYVLRGTAKLRTYDIGKLPRMQNHYWNVIQIGKEWFFVDPALGAGIVDYTEKTYQPDFNEKYFFTPPEQFFLNHFPKDKGWLKVEKSEEDFANLPLYYGECLKSEIELQEPLIGMFEMAGKDSIEFRIKSPKSIDKLSYQFNYEKEPTQLEVEAKGDEYSFFVPFLTKRRGYLTLYLDQKAILAYKINSY